MVRYLANGTPNSSFGTAGIFRWDLNNARDNAVGVAIMGWAGYWFQGLPLQHEARQAVVAVLRPDGTLVQRFNGGAAVSFAFGEQPVDFAQFIDVDDTAERILVTGFTDNFGQTQRFGAARLIGLDSQLHVDSFEAPSPL